MTDDAIPVGGPGTIIVRWADGTSSIYTLPADALAGFTFDNNKLIFRAYAVDQIAGVVHSYTLNFNQMRSFDRIGF